MASAPMWRPRSRTRIIRVAIVCAMWLTGVDVEYLPTLYIDSR